MSEPDSNIKSSLAQPFLVEIIEDLALTNSLSVDSLWEALGIVDLNRVSLHDLERAVTWLVTESQDAGLCLKICNQVGFNQLGTFGPLIASCGTIRDALHLFHSFKSLLHPLFDLTLIETQDHAEIVYAVDRDIALPPFYAETVVGGLPVWFKRLTGQDLQPISAKFRHSKPDYSEQYQDHFKSPILFDQPYDALVVDSGCLELSCLSASPRYHSNIMEKAKDQVGVTQTVTDIVADSFRNKLPLQLSFAQMAENLNYSERSLQRRLLEEGTNYKQLKQQLLKDEAIKLLETTQLSIEQIAYRLGYEQRSSFAAAFQRWTGVSPGRWRTQ